MLTTSKLSLIVCEINSKYNYISRLSKSFIKKTITNFSVFGYVHIRMHRISVASSCYLWAEISLVLTSVVKSPVIIVSGNFNGELPVTLLLVLTGVFTLTGIIYVA